VKLRLRYFASLRDAAGIDAEEVDVVDADAASLYESIAARHGFVLPRTRIRLAVNGEIVDWQRVLAPGDELVFLPPVSGG
jgi:molybdopterin synthase sulfur carrier subunit